MQGYAEATAPGLKCSVFASLDSSCPQMVYQGRKVGYLFIYGISTLPFSVKVTQGGRQHK